MIMLYGVLDGYKKAAWTSLMMAFSFVFSIIRMVFGFDLA